MKLKQRHNKHHDQEQYTVDDHAQSRTRENGSGRGAIMSNIIYDNAAIRVYDGLVRLCDYAGKSAEWCDELWQELLSDRQLYEEFVYYLEHHVPGDLVKVQGYSLTDLYVWQIEQYNLRGDSGKNTVCCNKEEMLLQALLMLTQMKKNPDSYLRKLDRGAGMDKI